MRSLHRVTLALGLLLVASCTRSAPKHSEETASNALPPPGLGAQAPSRAMMMPRPLDAATASVATPPAPAAAIDPARRLIRTVELELVVASVDSTSRQAQELASRLGGYVASMNAWKQDGVPCAELSLRIPGDRLEAALAQLRSWAKRVDREQQAVEDVTEQFVDLEARLRTLRATERELLALLAESRRRGQKLDDIMAVYRELTEVRTRIEQLQGQRDALDKLACLSTVTVRLRPDEIARPIAGTGWRPGDTLRASFRTLVATLRGLGDAAIVLLVAVLPIVAIVALPLVVAARWWRRRRIAAPHANAP